MDVRIEDFTLNSTLECFNVEIECEGVVRKFSVQVTDNVYDSCTSEDSAWWNSLDLVEKNSILDCFEEQFTI